MLDNDLLELVSLTVEQIPPSTLNKIIAELEKADFSKIDSEKQTEIISSILSQINKLLPISSSRYTVNKLFEKAKMKISDENKFLLKEISVALQVVAFNKQNAKTKEKINLVWTGPESRIPIRQTRQVLSQLIENTKEELLIVSFVVFKVPEILDLLKNALNREVKITCVFESPEESDGKIEFQGFRDFADGLLNKIDILVWDRDQRIANSKGAIGTLHAKCAVSDRKTSFISSANLTTNAMTLNMELGVLIYDEQIAREIISHFEQLRLNKVFKLRV
ncbi:MAG: DISARM system phospholipase D-like protein DrmC [Aridibacter sp.]